MRRKSSDLVFALAGALGLTLAACESGGVGDPCIPEDEYREGFPGYSKGEVNIESRSFQCETRVCLVHHFQGRVSCPYGQNVASRGEDGVVEGVDHNEQCLVPGTTVPITEPVRPQLYGRQAFDAVYCSCRCSGPDKNASYCECPGGFRCQELIEDYDLGRDQLVGSYCIRNGTEVSDPNEISGSPCQLNNENRQCNEKFAVY